MKLQLHQIHKTLGASFGEVRGSLVPSHYGDWTEEYKAATQRAAIMDASNKGKIKMVGKDSLDLLNRLSTNALDCAQSGSVIPNVLTTEKGRILDHMAVYIQDDSLLLQVSPGNAKEVIQWLDKYIILEEVDLTDVTDSFGLFSLLGPDTPTIIKKTLGLELTQTSGGKTQSCNFKGQEVWVSNVSLIHPLAVDVTMPAQVASPLWKHFLECGRDLNLTALGNQAYDALRIEAGVPLLGQDIGHDFNPLEAGLWKSVSFTKGCYIGQEVIARLNTYQKLKRHLKTMSFTRDVPVPRFTPLHTNGQEAGFITSWTYSLKHEKGIALGYVNRKASEAGSPLHVSLEDENLEVQALEPLSPEYT